jgi:hypothetical protein
MTSSDAATFVRACINVAGVVTLVLSPITQRIR